jgi:PAS domain S-box-containing protein
MSYHQNSQNENLTYKDLKQSEELYRLLFDNAPDAYFISDLKGKTIDANIATETLLGLNKEEIVGKNFLKLGFLSKNQLPEAIKLLGSVIAGKSSENNEYTFIRKDGSKVEADLRMRRIKFRDKTHILGIARDITVRKKAEETMKESEGQFKNLFNSMREGFALCEIICDKKGKPIDYRFLKINPAFGKQSGMDVATSIGKTIKEIYPDIESKWIERYGRVAITQEAIHFVDYDHNTDKYYDAIAFSPSKGTFAMLFRDITQQKKAEVALKESEEMHRLLYDNAPDAYYIIDLKGNFVDGNTVAQEIIGLNKSELIGKNMLKVGLLPKSQLPKAAMLLASNVIGKSTGPDELTLLRRDGSQLEVEISTHPVKIKDKTRVLSIARDISERKRLEEKLLSERNEFNTILQELPVGVTVLDSEDKVVYVNPISMQIDGYKKDLESLFNKDVRRIHSKHNLTTIEELLNDFKSGKKSYFSREAKRGTHSIEISYHAIRNAKGEYQGLTRLVSDITERKQAEEELKNSERKYRRLSEQLANSNSIKEILLDVISHDLRNPVGNLIGFSDLLLKKNPESEELSAIQQSSYNLLKVIDNANVLSKAALGEEIDKEDLDLTQILNTVIDEFEFRLEDTGIDLIKEIHESLQIKANPIIEEVFKNYVSNAIRYAKDGKQIILRTIEEKNFVSINVEDLGNTIPKENRELIFERNVQLTRGEKKGRGLGLAIVKRIAEAHNAEVGVKPNKPNGNIFYIKLPR